ncbi:SIS domain-containing protein [Sporohalobacter salinus]|uniref:SIS domain-containing protein n=1 Tax=Sporohalobacter salinus TaxID=1494606 RepID=UPI00196115D8|nr:SIS domain-containing protein [Sporohalobacter salinus]MBM7624940.1 fructoselysine-6-P-deglycase FrlB-like protein [Sporohalobacter salinus]
MNGNKIIKKIKKEEPEIKSIFFVGCGASKAELYPGKYLIESKAKNLHVRHYSSNEFVHATPLLLDNKSIVITCSHGGTTPETVKAAKMAKEMGAHVISVTNDSTSKLAQNGNYISTYEWKEESYQKCEKMGTVLQLAFEIIHKFENYKDYDKAIDAFNKIYGLIKKAVELSSSDAQEFAEKYKDEEIFYVMSSGATTEVAYAYSICLLMEMQWINSAAIHTGEYFHGPLEITDENIPFILLMNEGRTRPLDKRALEFLNRFGEKLIILDSKDFGLGEVIDPAVVEFFNPMLLTGVLREYAERFAVARNHPLTKRRYMWKIEY